LFAQSERILEVVYTTRSLGKYLTIFLTICTT